MVRTRASSYTSDQDEAPDATHALATEASQDPVRERPSSVAAPPSDIGAEVPAQCAATSQSRSDDRAAPSPASSAEVPAQRAAASQSRTAARAALPPASSAEVSAHSATSSQSRTATRAAPPPTISAEVPAHSATSSQSRTAARAAPPPARNSEVPAHSATPSTAETAQAQSPPINQSTFEYRGQTYGPIAKWPGSYASEETIHSPSGDFAYLREWLAEQRRGPHSGQFVSEYDDLLILSSDEEDGIDEPGVFQLAAVYCSPKTDSRKERHAIYCAQLMVGVVERYHRHQRSEDARYGFQLARIMHDYNGTGPTRPELRDLQRACRDEDLTPQTEVAAEGLMVELLNQMALHDADNCTLLQLFTRMRATI